MTRPLVTIGMPCFNSAATLERAIASVKAQEFDDWQLHLSDDTSSDATWDICQHAARDPRITATRQSKRRMFMNFGDLLHATGSRYFVWLAADDYWSPAFLAVCVGALEAQPEAVSALPQCAFLDGDETVDDPDTAALSGSYEDRACRFLAAPGGTRMYGVMRTEAAQTAFPHRMMNAYDWYFMLGLLRAGTQTHVPRTLLYRERSDWMGYTRMVGKIYRNPVLRRWPILDMSVAAMRAGLVPRAALKPLLMLNLLKHEEYLLINRPSQFARRFGLFRRLGLPLASHPGYLVPTIETLLRRAPEIREGLEAALQRVIALGVSDAMLAMGHARKDELLEGDPFESYTAAAEAGAPDGLFHATRLRVQRGMISSDAAWSDIVAAAFRGSDAARAYLSASEAHGTLPPAVAKVAETLLPRP